MAHVYKICRNCGTKTAEEDARCPHCGGEDFTTVNSESLGWSNAATEDTTKMFPLTQNVVILDEDEKKTASVKPKKKKKKKKRRLRSFQEVIAPVKASLDRLEGKTKKLLALFAALLLIVVIALVIAFTVSGNSSEKQTAAAASPTATATAEATAESAEATANPDGSRIGSVTIIEDIINIRVEANTSAAALGIAEQGQSYDVYEIVENEGYTWYRIGTQQWIANGDDWVEYTAD